MANPPIKSVIFNRTAVKPPTARPAGGPTIGGLSLPSQQPKAKAAKVASPAAPKVKQVVVGHDSLGVPIYGVPASPVHVDARGAVLNPVNGVGLLTRPAAKPPRLKVTIHPSGKIEVNHAATPAPAANSAPSSAPAAAITPKPKTSVKPPATTAPRAPAAATGAAPQLSDTQQAENQVSAAFDPVAKQLQDFYTQQTQGEAAAIKGATSGLADLYSQYAPAAASAYTGAENSQAAVGAALSKALVGQSDAAQAGLAAQLAKIGNPDSAAVINGQAATNAQGAQGVQAAGNSAALTGLIGRGAAAADYGAKLPGLAGLYGLNATQNATTKLGSDFNTAIQALDAKRPEALQTALAGISANKFKQQQLNLEGKAFGLKVNADKRAQQSLDNQTATTLSNLYGVDAKGNLTLAGRKVAALEQKAQATLKGAGKSKPLTTAQVNGLTEKASKDAETFYYGKSPSLYQGQPVAGTGTPPILYPAAVQRLMAKYPGLTVSRATKILNSYYKPGEGGRPVFTKKQQQANAVAFPDPFAGLTGLGG